MQFPMRLLLIVMPMGDEALEGEGIDEAGRWECLVVRKRLFVNGIQAVEEIAYASHDPLLLLL